MNSKFDQLYKTIMEDTKSSKIKAKKVIKEDYDDLDEDEDDLLCLEDNEEVYEGVKQCLADNIESVVDEMDLDEDQYEELLEAGLVGLSAPQPDLFDECIYDDEVSTVIDKLLEDDNEENWNELDKAILKWVRLIIQNVLNN